MGLVVTTGYRKRALPAVAAAHLFARLVVPFRYFLLAALAAVALLSATDAAAQQDGSESLVIIANESVDRDVIARRTLRAIFGMRMRSWGDGESITVYVLDDRDPQHMSFCERLLGMLPYNLRRNWDRLIFSGTGRAPIRVSSAQEMIDLVSRTPGAIGYVSEDLVNESVSVLQIG